MQGGKNIHVIFHKTADVLDQCIKKGIGEKGQCDSCLLAHMFINIHCNESCSLAHDFFKVRHFSHNLPICPQRVNVCIIFQLFIYSI